jgi:hypothetical protein
MLTVNGHTSATHARCFRVGRDHEGHWVAIDRSGTCGGIFVSQEAALDYAAAETERRPGAVSVTTEPVELRI